MDTVAELERYLEENCYSFNELTIGKHHAYEGIIIEKNGAEYHFSHSERGRKEVLRAFQTEKELVDYAFSKLNKNDWWKAHLVAATYDPKEIARAEWKLRFMRIKFRRNDIPCYYGGRHWYRIFVFGRDILRLEAFKKQYLHYSH